jgi:hypothetical protein
MSNTPCFICLEENTEKFFPYCKCEYHAHKKCYKEHLEKNGTCPYCHTVLRSNPMIEACQELPTLYVPHEEKKEWNPAANSIVCCCLLYFCSVGIIGAVFG